MDLTNLALDKERYYLRHISDKEFMSRDEWKELDRKISDKIKIDQVKMLAGYFGIRVPTIFSSATGIPLIKEQISEVLTKNKLVNSLEEAISETDKLISEGVTAEPYSPYYTRKIYKLSFEEVVNHENSQIKYIPRYQRYIVDESPREGMG